jgi:hypothetical protein
LDLTDCRLVSSKHQSSLSVAMPDSDDFGDSDDEALLFAATQADTAQTQDDFEESPRPSKRRRTDGGGSNDSNASADEFDDEEMFDEGGVEDASDEPPKKPKHLMHVPKFNPNMDRIVLTQTQRTLAPSQPWMIRGPIWKKPKPVEKPAQLKRAVTFQTTTKGSEDAALLQDSDNEDELEAPAPQPAQRTEIRTQAMQV